MMEEPLKLLIAADTYYPQVDGTLRFMEEFINRSSSDFNLSLLVPNFGVKINNNVIALKTSKWIKLSGYPIIKISFKNLNKIKQAISNTDLVFIQGPALISYLSMYYAKKFKKKSVFYLHVISWELFEKFLPPLLNKIFFSLIKNISIRLYNYCDEIIVPYHDLIRQLRKEGVKTKITVARLGVDINRFSPPFNKKKSKEKVHLDPEKQVIGYVGRISKEKNINILVEAFQKINTAENMVLLIVGGGPEHKVKEIKKIKNCIITGFVNDVHNYLKAMDVFVMPSLTETTSLATLEAMSTGLPVIATKVGFIKSYLIRDHNGMFFPRDSSSVLAVKIEKLLKDASLCEQLGKNARRTVAYSFSWERSINKIKRILRNLVYTKG